MRDTAVIIVNFRCEEHTLACVRHLLSIEAERPAEIIVVDNSPSESLAWGLLRADPAVIYRPQSENLGFAGGVNCGLRHATGDIVILLNPDARPESGCISGLIEIVRHEGDVVAGPALVSLDPARPHGPSALRRDPDWKTALVEYTVAHRLVGSNWLDREYFLRSEDVDSLPVECATVQGACMVFPRRLIEQVGAFDADRFFLYWEETDFLRRVREAGGRVLYCPHLSCRHQGSASTADGRQDVGLFWRGLYRYHRKYGSRGSEILLRLAMVSGMIAELGVLSTLYLLRRRKVLSLSRDLGTLLSRLREQFRVRPTGRRGSDR